MGPYYTERVKKVLQLAREEAKRLNNDYIGTEHLLLALIRAGKGVAMAVLEELDVDINRLKVALEESVSSSGGTMTIGEIPLTPLAKKVMDYAKEEAELLKHNYIGTEHILLGILHENEGIAYRLLAQFHVDLKRAREETIGILGGDPALINKSDDKEKSTTPVLDHFSRDLTQLASESKLDPIIGREKEIQRVSQVLSRRKKNNPVLIGEPGVGKTAIVEGLAQLIVSKSVPHALLDKRVLTLDLAGVVAGTKYRGQFEERLKLIITELQQSEDVIIFLDEIHTLIGAGGAEGAMDAANMLKPALARGEIRCIGATTLDEYRKHFEKDGALERRFQSVIVEPPSVEDAIDILRGLKEKYEEHHHVVIEDEAIIAAVKMSERYISDRYLPDKAIDVIDEAGAKLQLKGDPFPPEIREMEKKLAKTTEAKEQAVKDQKFEEAAHLRDREKELQAQLERQKEEAKHERRNYGEVDHKLIAEVVSDISGVPVSHLQETESLRLLRMEEELHKRIVGQDEAITALSSALRRSRSGLKDPRRPIGSYIFLGPTGVGKTEMARALAEFLFNDTEALIRLDMSEYMEKFSVSRLMGAPPGYVGYQEGGQLTERVRRKPYSVVLFDEIEKAHPDIFNVLLQILDDGVLTDSYGRHVSFKNCILIMTSNLGARSISKTSLGFHQETEESAYEKMKSNVMDQVKNAFNPEFINRLDEIIVFHTLSREQVEKIIEILLEEIRIRLSEKTMSLKLEDEAIQFLIDKGYNPEYGARPLKRAIQQYIENPLSEELLRGSFNEGDRIIVQKREDKLILVAEDNPVKLNELLT